MVGEVLADRYELVTRLGGTGVPVAIDHLDSAAVARLASRIRDEHGHIDILVNDIWGAEVLKGGPAEWNTPAPWPPQPTLRGAPRWQGPR